MMSRVNWIQQSKFVFSSNFKNNGKTFIHIWCLTNLLRDNSNANTNELKPKQSKGELVNYKNSATCEIISIRQCNANKIWNWNWIEKFVLLQTFTVTIAKHEKNYVQIFDDWKIINENKNVNV